MLSPFDFTRIGQRDLVGSVIERGPVLAVERIAPAPASSIIRLLMWGFGFFLITFVWRVPRRSLVGKHDLNTIACFAAGVFMAALHYLAVVLMYELGLMTINWSQSSTQVSIVIALLLSSAIASVECEAFISRHLVRRSHSTKESADK